MRRPRMAGGVLLLAAACGLPTGCMTPGEGTTRTTAWYDRVRGWAGATPLAADAADGMHLQTALIDRPAPDSFLNRDLWSAGTSSNPLTAEQTALLEVNGLRVRVTGGIPPAPMMKMLGSDDALDRMARTVRPGVPRVVPVNGPLESLQFAVRRDLKADPAAAELSDAECGLSVTARPADGGRVTLRCEPQVQFGDRQQFIKPSADGNGFSRQEQKPLETYPTLGFEVTLSSGEYLIVGPTADPVGTIGQGFFYTSAGDRVRQRVLVVRAVRPDGPAKPAGVKSTATAAAASQGGTARLTARGVMP